MSEQQGAPLVSKRKVVAVAGATGYIGRAVVEALRKDHHVVAFSRSPHADFGPDVEVRRCDLYSILQLEEALKGVDEAVYLVHSMLPKSGLTQASFEDLDYLLADNFARAAKKCEVGRLVYLGGIVPKEGELSPHLRSRLEVEKTLSSRGAVVSTLRAGLIIGANGSSFNIVERLVERLPAMLLPAWSRTKTQPIALRDAVDLIVQELGTKREASVAFDIAGDEVVTYRHLIEAVAQHKGKRSPFVDVPFVSPGLSCLWVSLFSSQPYALVAPLVASLVHEMLPDDRQRLRVEGRSATTLPEALTQALSSTSARSPGAESVPRQAPRKAAPHNVRSVQRLRLPPGYAAQDLAREYMNFLPQLLSPFLRVEVDNDRVAFFVRGLSAPLLVLHYSDERSSPRRALFYVEGGSLSGKRVPNGRLEFRISSTADCALAALHDFEPRLPWHLYRATQAPMHLLVMQQFAAHLQRIASSGQRPSGKLGAIVLND